MHLRKKQLLFISSIILVIVTLFFAGNSQPFGRFSLGILFTVLLWQRTDQHISRWLAVLLLWAGILVAGAWTWLIR